MYCLNRGETMYALSINSAVITRELNSASAHMPTPTMTESWPKLYARTWVAKAARKLILSANIHRTDSTSLVYGEHWT